MSLISNHIVSPPWKNESKHNKCQPQKQNLERMKNTLPSFRILTSNNTVNILRKQCYELISLCSQLYLPHTALIHNHSKTILSTDVTMFTVILTSHSLYPQPLENNPMNWRHYVHSYTCLTEPLSTPIPKLTVALITGHFPTIQSSCTCILSFVCNPY
jgi:hypothetical protein